MAAAGILVVRAYSAFLFMHFVHRRPARGGPDDQAKHSRHRLHELRDRAMLRALLVRTKYRRQRMVATKSHATRGENHEPATPLPSEQGEGWKQELCHSHVVSNYGHVLTRIPGSDEAWAAGALLPMHGSTFWKVRVAQKRREGGLLCIGVCDADSTCGWGLHLGSGRLLRFTRNGSSGHVDTIDVGPPPKGLPDMRGRKMIVDSDTGEAVRVQGAIQGSVLTCGLDADGGTFSISVNGSAARVALSCLPKRCALRPWARLAHATDQVEIEFERLNVGSWLGGRARLQQRLLGRPRGARLPRLQRV